MESDSVPSTMGIPESNESADWFSPVDNTSNRRAESLLLDSSTFEACPDRPRGPEVILRRLARIYRSSSVVFIFVTLMVGLIVGVWVGRKWEQRRCRNCRNTENADSKVCFDLSPWIATTQMFSKLLALLSSLSYWTMPALLHNHDNSENYVRAELQDIDKETRESGVDIAATPKHVAVIMDGNRRYGRSKYGSATKVRSF